MRNEAGGKIVYTSFEVQHTRKRMSELVSLPRSSSEEVHAVWESTGSFHCLVATALLENGIFVSIVNSLRMEWELPLPARQYYQKASILINSKVDSF